MIAGVTDDAAALRLKLEVEDFLITEAELLDDRRLHDWLELLADEVDYRIPVRLSRVRVGGGPEYSEQAYHLIADAGGLRTRVSRFDTGFAWAEETASRTRRLIGNIRIKDVTSDIVRVRSNLLMFRARDDMPATLLAGERHDVLLRTPLGLRLTERNVYLDHTYLPTENLAMLL